MAGLLMLGALIAWGYVSYKIAAKIASAAESRIAKASWALAVFAVIFIAPIADDLFGSWQYKQYCKAGDKISYLGKISIPAEVGLFSADGEWKIAKLGPTEGSEKSRLGNLAERFVRWEHGARKKAGNVAPITEQETKIIERSSGKVLAKWMTYRFSGGFLRRGFLDSSQQCSPRAFDHDLYGPIFVLERKPASLPVGMKASNSTQPTGPCTWDTI